MAAKRRNRIPILLAELGWTIQDLSHETRMTYHHVYKITRAEKIPSGTTYDTLTKLSRALGVAIDDLEDVVEE